jgi:hypothetical protein
VTERGNLGRWPKNGLDLNRCPWRGLWVLIGRLDLGRWSDRSPHSIEKFRDGKAEHNDESLNVEKKAPDNLETHNLASTTLVLHNPHSDRLSLCRCMHKSLVINGLHHS